MKKSEVIYLIVVVLLVAAIIAVILFRFVLKKGTELVEIGDTDEITLMSVKKEVVTLSKLMEKSGTLYFIIFNIDGCYSCIVRGLNDLSALQGEGKYCIAIVIHNDIDEIKGWAEKQDFSPFYMMKKSVFYDYIKTPHVPLFVHLKNGLIKNFQFITP